MKEVNADNDEKLNFVNEKKILIKENTYKIDSLKRLKKEYPDKSEKIEEALLNYMGENYLKTLNTEFSDKWKY